MNTSKILFNSVVNKRNKWMLQLVPITWIFKKKKLYLLKFICDKGSWGTVIFSVFFFFFKIKCILFWGGRYAWATLHDWGSEDNLQDSIFSFHHVYPRDWTQNIRLCSKITTKFPVVHIYSHRASSHNVWSKSNDR